MENQTIGITKMVTFNEDLKVILKKGKFLFPVGNNHSALTLQTLSSPFVRRIIAHSVNNAHLEHSTM